MKARKTVLVLALIVFLGSNIPFLIYSAVNSIESSGKIYRYKNMLLAGKRHEAIMIYDVTEPADPVHLSTIELDTVDFAAYRNHLYADSLTDLFIYDISDPGSPKEKGKIEEVFYVFPEHYSINCAPPPLGCYDGQSDSSYHFSSYSEGGSMARFTIVGEHLYCVRGNILIIYDLADPVLPEEVNRVDLGWDVETLFPHDENHLFVGRRSGMYIMDISIPKEAYILSEFAHLTACDPVVTEGDKAYLTLRGGNACGNWFNQMDILDVSNMTDPRFLWSHTLFEPYGLAVDGHYVFVCDGPAGLKQLNVENYKDIHVVSEIKTIKPFDIIKSNDILYVSAIGGVFIFQMVTPEKPSFLAEIPL